MMEDPNHNVRKEAVQLLSALLHCKPLLLAPVMQGVLPMLYKQTIVDTSLITIKDLGPFTHKEDLGLDLRKATFECMEVCFLPQPTLRFQQTVCIGKNVRRVVTFRYGTSKSMSHPTRRRSIPKNCLKCILRLLTS